ncbi:carboxymuconolactone decarboxylase family protein [Aeromicrobium sp. CF4.19]|uniref:carboxymuconolactone decarboxylase family protein n=1 Tax=Aeromicrobium sp. CF4.19 TaxID=3373082 RepID=UPI003EE42998
MSRIQPLAPAAAGSFVRLAYRLARRQLGEVPEPFAVTAHHPRLFRTSLRHELGLQRASHVASAPLVELAVYRTGRTVGCSWCVDFGEMLQRMEGLDVERLRHIDDFETHPAFTEDEREVIRLSDAMTATPMTVTDEQVTRLVAQHGRDGALELVYQVAHENHRARFNHALGITDQGYSSGDACRVPWATT